MKKYALFLITLIAVINIHSARAASDVPVNDSEAIDTANDILEKASKTAKETAKATANQIEAWKNTFKVANLKKQIVDLLSEKVMGYTQGGDVNAPKFVTNWQSYLSDARTASAQGFGSSLSASEVCSPFRKQLLDTMGASGNPGSTGGQAMSEFKCEFSASQFSAFNDDFKNGGWDMYMKTLEPEGPNNFNGALLKARKIQASAIIEAEKAAQNEALAGQGFLGAKKDGITITTPGIIIKELTAKASTADIDLVMNSNQLTGIIGALSDSFVTQLSNPDDSGLSNINVADHSKNRKDRTADRKKNRGKNCDLSTVDLSAEALADISECNDESATNEAILLGTIEELISTRRTVKAAFKNVNSRNLQKLLKSVTDDISNPPALDTKRECRDNLYGRKPRDGEPTQKDINNGATMPARASSVDTGRRAYRVNVGGDTHVRYRVCLTQNKYTFLAANIADRQTLETENTNALNDLLEFRLGIKALDPDASTYETKVADLMAEFALLSHQNLPEDASGISAGPNPEYNASFDALRAEYLLTQARGDLVFPEDNPSEEPVDETPATEDGA